jgi:hypothetical protein
MNRFAMILTVVILPAFVLPAPADGIFGIFGKKTKVNPAQRVPELIVSLKTDQEERKRASAAAELGAFDAATFPEIVPVLTDALQSDPKPAVRMDAASSLGNLRPVSQMAGQALEKAVHGDDNWRVRWHVKGILMKYRMAGYSSGAKGKAAAPSGPQTGEPPLLDGSAIFMAAPPTRGVQPPPQFPTGPTPVAKTSAQSPGMAFKKDDALEFRPSVPRPLPPGPTFTTAVPQRISQPVPELPMVDADGPALTPVPQR